MLNDRATAALLKLHGDAVWPMFGPDPVYEGPAARLVERCSACVRCGRATPWRSWTETPRVRGGDAGRELDWQECSSCPEPVPVLAVHLGVDVAEVEAAVARFEVGPPTYQMAGGQPDRPVQAWSHLPATAYGIAVPRAGECAFCGAVRSNRWRPTPMGQSCGNFLCTTVWSPGDMLRGKGQVVAGFLRPDDLDRATLEPRVVGLLIDRLAGDVELQPRFFHELDADEQDRHRGRPWAWITSAVVERWRHEVGDVDLQRTAPQAWAAGRAEQARDAERRAEIERLVDQRLAGR